MKYDFQCQDCQAVQEVTLKLKDLEPTAKLCSCGGISRRVHLRAPSVNIPTQHQAASSKKEKPSLPINLVEPTSTGYRVSTTAKDIDDVL